jgi:hypothetical protein
MEAMMEAMMKNGGAMTQDTTHVHEPASSARSHDQHQP